MDHHESILSEDRNSVLINWHQNLQNVTTYLISGAIVAVILCLTHYFYLIVLRQVLQKYILKGKRLRIVLRFCK